MAVRISWDNQLRSAIHELQFVVAEDPSNASARVNLARIYSWDGQSERAIEMADGVLSEHPDNDEALLVKANALEWTDRFDDAISIYNGLIEHGSFDAKIGLASSLLYEGNRAAAQRQANLLTASDARQKRELQKLSDSIRKETRPQMDIGYTFYSDSDENHFGRYLAHYRVAAGNNDLEMNVSRTDASNGMRSDDASFLADFNAAGTIGLAAGLGFTRLNGGAAGEFPTGLLRLHTRWEGTTVTATASSEILNETPQLIENHVRKLSAGIDASQKITARWSMGGAYNRFRFSDTNQANDAQVRTEFAITHTPRIVLGYQARYTDYRTQSGSGFFDPSNFVSHRISGSFYLERRKFLAFVQIYGGHQKFERFGYWTSEWAKGGNSSFGFKPNSNLTISVNVVAGGFATGSVSGFRYFTAGSKVSFRF
jgi:tetratricopeptide (TPR) repeat protein